MTRDRRLTRRRRVAHGRGLRGGRGRGGGAAGLLGRQLRLQRPPRSRRPSARSRSTRSGPPRSPCATWPTPTSCACCPRSTRCARCPRPFGARGGEAPVWRGGLRARAGSAHRRAPRRGLRRRARRLPAAALHGGAPGAAAARRIWTTAEAFETLKHYLSLAGLGPVDDDALLAAGGPRVRGTLPRLGARAHACRPPWRTWRRCWSAATCPCSPSMTRSWPRRGERIVARDPARRALDLLETRDAARALGQMDAGPPPWARPARGPSSAPRARRSRTGSQGSTPARATAPSSCRVCPRWPRSRPARAGCAAPARPPRATSRRVAAEAMELYWAEFTQRWRETVSDLKVRERGEPRGRRGPPDAARLRGRPAAPPRGGGGRGHRPRGRAGGGGGALGRPPLPFDPLAAPDPYEPLRRVLGEADAAEEGEGPLAALDPLLARARPAARPGVRGGTHARRRCSTRAGRSRRARAGPGRRGPRPARAARPLDGGPRGPGRAGHGGARAGRSLGALGGIGGAPNAPRAVAGRYPFEPGRRGRGDAGRLRPGLRPRRPLRRLLRGEPRGLRGPLRRSLDLDRGPRHRRADLRRAGRVRAAPRRSGGRSSPRARPSRRWR